MFDEHILKDALEKYKQDFVSTTWEKEKYKWEAIKTFQDNWDENATDFADMLSQSLSKTKNLLESKHYAAKTTITVFAKEAPEEVRAMFIALFDESVDVIERIMTFKDKSKVLNREYKDGAYDEHYQENFQGQTPGNF